MPRGPKISPATRRNWLEAYERGERIDKIARDAGRTERTVNEHVQLARQEREEREVRGWLLRDAYQKHFDDLLGLAEELREASKKPSPHGLLAVPDRKTRMLLEALKGHIPKSELWRASKDRGNHARRLDIIEEGIERHIAARVEREVRTCFSEVTMDGFTGSLWVAVREAAEGRDAIDRKYRLETTLAVLRLKWGEFVLANKASDEASKACDEARLMQVEHKHTQLLEELTAQKSELLTKLSEVVREWNEAQDTVEQEVESLVLRRMLPGQCYLCPGSDRKRGRKSRSPTT